MEVRKGEEGRRDRREKSKFRSWSDDSVTELLTVQA